MISFAQWVILNYSRLQIKFTKLYKSIKSNPLIGKYIVMLEKKYEDLYNDYDPNIIEVFSQGNAWKYNKNEISRYNLTFIDFMIDTHLPKHNTEGPYSKIIYHSIPTTFEYKKCNYRFISVTLSLPNDNKYNLKLFSEKENYFIVGNRFDRNVFNYLLNKQYNLTRNLDNIPYQVEIIDHDINITSLTENDTLHFYLDKYEIISPKNDENKEDDTKEQENKEQENKEQENKEQENKEQENKEQENKEQENKEQSTKGIRSLSNDYIEVEKI
jgi:hypothetical protein